MTSAGTGSTRMDWLLPRNWSLPAKLAAVLTVPIVLAMTLGALRVSDQIDDVTALGGRAQYLTARDAVTALVIEMQRERYHSAVYVASNRGGERVPPRSAFTATDKRRAEVADAIGDATALGDGPGHTYRQVTDELSRLAALRGRVADAPATEAPAVIARYTGLIGSLLTFAATLDRRLDSPSVAGLAFDMTALGAAREQVALQHVVIAAAITRGVLAPPDADTVRAADTQLATTAGQLRVGMADGHRQLLRWAESGAARQRQQLKQIALGRVARGPLSLDRGQWDTANGTVLADLRAIEAGVRAEIGSISVAWRERARDAAGLNSVLLLLGLLSTAGVVYGIGRSMLNPLRVLRRTALEVANHRLPDAVRAMREGRAPAVTVKPVAVTSTEEIGQVARAFDAVHGQAVRLAAEQATLQTSVSGMFVNLSRRSQSLVERQLRLIEQLERNEQDAEQLANLFRLDHLATRMRRNSDNLLILAGSEVTQRANQAIPVVDVLRAAVSEIEQYQRVVVRTSLDARILGRAANDLVHLVAELLDNATNFSPPDTQVVLDSTRTSDGSVLFEITDEGVGMPSKELAAANRRLSGTLEVDVSASRRMGLFVVGRLAARHQIRVRLASTDLSRGPRAGITAYVHVLPHLVTAPATNGPGSQAPDADHRPTQPAPATASVPRPEIRSEGRPASGTENPTRSAAPHLDPASATGSATLADPVEPRRRVRGPRRPTETAPDGTDPFTDDQLLMPVRSASEPSTNPPQPDETPIYTRMESAWFRSGGGRELPRQRPGAAPSARQGASTTGHEPTAGPALAPARSGDPESAATNAAAKQQFRRWDASDPMRPMPEAPPSALTPSGLPKRKPHAQLIPRGDEAPATEPREVPARRPERARGLLASYQEGLRQGRAGCGGPWRAGPQHVPSRTGGEQG